MSTDSPQADTGLLARARGLHGVSIALCALYALFYGSLAAWAPFFNIYLGQIGMTGLEIGVIAGARPLVTLISQPVWGFFADTRGRRRMLLMVLLASTLILPGFLLHNAFVFLLGWVMLFTFVSSPIGPLIDSLNLDHLDSRPGASFGQFRLWGAVGWATIGAVVGALINGRDIRLIFVFGALLLFSCGGLTAFARLPAGASDVAASSWRGAGKILRQRPLLLFLALTVGVQIGAGAIPTIYPIYMSQIGASSQLIGLAITAQGISELPLYLGAAWMIKRVGPLPMLLLAISVYAARQLLYSVIRVPELALLVELSHGLSFALFLVASVEVINRQVGQQWRATGQSLFWAAFAGAGGMLGNLWAGWLADQIGLPMLFRLNGVLLLAILVVAWLLLRGMLGEQETADRTQVGRE